MVQRRPHKLVSALLAVKALRAASSLRVLRFTLYRQWLDFQYKHKQLPQEQKSIGVFSRYEKTPSGWRFKFAEAAVEIEFLKEDLARLTWTPGTPPIPYALAETALKAIHPTLDQTKDGFSFTTEALTVELSFDGSLTFRQSSGELLRRVLPPVRQGTGWTETCLLTGDEHLYGLGEQAGHLNLRDQTHHIWNQDPGGSYGKDADPLYMPLPCYFSLQEPGSYLIFYENSHRAIFSPGFDADLGMSTYQAAFNGGSLRYYFIPGSAPEALEQFSQLTGTSPLPPMWSLGYHQSRWGYENQAEIEALVAGFKENDLGLSAVHLDLDYMDDRRGFTIDGHSFPNMAELAHNLANSAIHLVTIVDPGIKTDPHFDIYQDGLEKQAYLSLPGGKTLTGVAFAGETSYPDFTSPDVRQWWSELYPRLLDKGISGFWHDMNEPTSFSAWGGNSLPLATQHNLEGAGGDHLQAHNVYGLQMNRSGFESLRRYRPQSRPWILSRSGWIGNQRYAWNWTADTESTWDGMRTNLTTIIGLGLCGIPYCGPDIGGFSGDPTAELYLRWFQMAAFLPFFRTHSALITQPREPWVFGEPYTSIVRRFINLRYQLMPYTYTLAWEASQKGYPFVRPLFWHSPQDRRLWDIEDAYLYGDALLIAPVLEPGAQRREVVLPAGDWYSFTDDTQYTGPERIFVPVCLETLPTFVRGGSVLPMADGPRLTLHIYPGELVNKIYSDAGDGYDAWRLDRFFAHGDHERLNLTWHAEGDYPLPYVSVGVQIHGMKVKKMICDGAEHILTAQRAETGRFSNLTLLA
jgi:alpha-glucosidase